MILGLAMVSELGLSSFLLLRFWWLINIVNYRCALYMFLFNSEFNIRIFLYLTWLLSLLK